MSEYVYAPYLELNLLTKFAIAVDYDNTISLSPSIFAAHLPKLAKDLSLKLIVATSRTGTADDIKVFEQAGLIGDNAWVDDVIWCGRHWKIDVCEKAGYVVLFWVDDQPEGCKRGGILWARIVGAYKWLVKKWSSVI
ncbi:MAG: hypothetical protein M0R80_02345 [Proteobacteria bacterium]|jgi:hypothetical protein|nr:hypothetical protein [Pseudomonadota bacterium]